MRLIDKDNLRKPSKGIFIYQDEFEDDVQHIAFEAYTKDDIEREPTVQAIPIEWLKRWFERQVWQGSSPTDRIHCKASDIIEDWEKENEHNRLG